MRGILALLAVLACLAGLAVAELRTSFSGPATPRPLATSPTRTAGPRQQRLAAVSWPARAGDSLVPVAAGEMLTERQALEALLLPSADNMARILARWDAGSQVAFVARMRVPALAAIVAATFGQPGTAETILPDALRAGHNLVLALDRALARSRGDVVQGDLGEKAMSFGAWIGERRILAAFLGTGGRDIDVCEAAASGSGRSHDGARRDGFHGGVG
jgi:hypothetical protein